MRAFVGIGIAIAALGLAFQAGRAFEAFRYDDICLDMGGGRNPGNHPICVISSGMPDPES